MADEELEQTLCVIKECYVYKIPPLKSATGHRASVIDDHAMLLIINTLLLLHRIGMLKEVVVCGVVD